MQISSNFTIAAQTSHVFGTLLDPKVMIKCIQGCEELERIDETHYRGRITNEVAHIKFNARFAAEITELDYPNHIRAVLNGEDRHLGSSIKVTILLDLEPTEEGSAIAYQMEIALWGKLGRLGESIVRRKSLEFERDFISELSRACVQPEYTPGPSSSQQEAPTPEPVQIAVPPAAPTSHPPAAASRPIGWFAKLLAFFRRSR